MLNRLSLARKPSLSTIDSVDTRRFTQSPQIQQHQQESNNPQINSKTNTNMFSKKDQTTTSTTYIPQAESTMDYSSSTPPPINTQYQTPFPKHLVRVPTTQTKYMEMLLHLDRIPRIYNILAGAFTWILLASFLIIPGTFTSFKNSDLFKEASSDEDKSNAIARAILHSAANVGLLWVSGIFCVIGGMGCLFLWFRWRKNYVWLVNKVFL